MPVNARLNPKAICHCPNHQHYCDSLCGTEVDPGKGGEKGLCSTSFLADLPTPSPAQVQSRLKSFFDHRIHPCANCTKHKTHLSFSLDVWQHVKVHSPFWCLMSGQRGASFTRVNITRTRTHTHTYTHTHITGPWVSWSWILDPPEAEGAPLPPAGLHPASRVSHSVIGWRGDLLGCRL